MKPARTHRWGFRVLALAASLVGATLTIAADDRGSASTAQEGPAASPPAVEPFEGLHQRLLQAAERTLSAGTRQIEAEEHGLQENPQPAGDELRRFAVRYWRGRTDALQAALDRVHMLAPLVVPALQEEGIPAELLAVVLVESAGRPDALSPQGARGLWQFIPATARRYGLTVEASRDDRLEIRKSTRAAARHLSDLRNEFQDWRLALAAYNAGGKAVRSAIRRAGTRDFDALSARRLLPEETRAYVPAVLDAARLFGNPELSDSDVARQDVVPRIYAQPRAD